MSVQTLTMTSHYPIPDFIVDHSESDISLAASDETTTFTFSSSPASFARPPTPGRGPLSSHPATPMYSLNKSTPSSSIGKNSRFGKDSVMAGSPSFDNDFMFGRTDSYVHEYTRPSIQDPETWKMPSIQPEHSLIKDAHVQSETDSIHVSPYRKESLSLDTLSSHDDSRPVTPTRPQGKPLPRSGTRGIRKFLSIASLRPTITAMPPLPSNTSLSQQSPSPPSSSSRRNVPIRVDYSSFCHSSSSDILLSPTVHITEQQHQLSSPPRLVAQLPALSNPAKLLQTRPGLAPPPPLSVPDDTSTYLTYSPANTTAAALSEAQTPTSASDFPRSPQSFSSRLSRHKSLSWFKPRFSALLPLSPGGSSGSAGGMSPVYNTDNGTGVADGGDGISPTRRRLSIVPPKLPELYVWGSEGGVGGSLSAGLVMDSWGEDIFADIGR